jgi:predicted nucleic acid-binding protein
MRSYLDSDVLIGHLRGDRRARALLERLSSGGHADLWIGALQRIEIVFFMHPDETDDTEAFLQRFHTDSLTEEIVDYAGVLYRQWHPSHGTGINDCVLAAMALLSGGKIYTRNLKHFPMPGLSVVRAW